MLILFAMALLLVVFSISGATAYRLAHPPRKTFAVALARGQPTDPQAAGLQGEPCRFALSGDQWTDGFDMRGGDPDGPVVVFTHGWSDSRYGGLTWAGQMAPFTSRIVVYDLRGHGDSPVRCSRLGAREVDDLLAVIEQLDLDGQAISSTRQPLVLWGHSLGAMVTLAAAAQADRHRVDAVVVDGVVANFAQAVSGRLRWMRLPGWLLTPLAMGIFAAWDVNAVRLRATTAAADLACPLLVMHGDADPIAAVASAQDVAARHFAAKLVVFPGGGHSNLAEYDAGRYRAVLKEFFSGLHP